MPSLAVALQGCATLVVRVANPRYYKVTVWVGPGQATLAADLSSLLESPTALHPMPPAAGTVGWLPAGQSPGPCPGIDLEVTLQPKALVSFLRRNLSSPLPLRRRRTFWWATLPTALYGRISTRRGRS
jgi:hypothetical protein